MTFEVPSDAAIPRRRARGLRDPAASARSAALTSFAALFLDDSPSSPGSAAWCHLLISTRAFVPHPCASTRKTRSGFSGFSSLLAGFPSAAPARPEATARSGVRGRSGMRGDGSAPGGGGHGIGTRLSDVGSELRCEETGAELGDPCGPPPTRDAIPRLPFTAAPSRSAAGLEPAASSTAAAPRPGPRGGGARPRSDPAPSPAPPPARPRLTTAAKRFFSSRK